MRRFFYAPKPSKLMVKYPAEHSRFRSGRAMYSHGSYSFILGVYAVSDGQHGVQRLFCCFFPFRRSSRRRLYLRTVPPPERSCRGADMRNCNVRGNRSCLAYCAGGTSGNKKAPPAGIFLRGRRSIRCKFKETKGAEE